MELRAPPLESFKHASLFRPKKVVTYLDHLLLRFQKEFKNFNFRRLLQMRRYLFSLEENTRVTVLVKQNLLQILGNAAILDVIFDYILFKDRTGESMDVGKF